MRDDGCNDIIALIYCLIMEFLIFIIIVVVIYKNM